MQLRFESQTRRVKGICFHPYKSWVIISLHTGSIQIWDYIMGIPVAKFQDHDRPVRSVDFHKQLPLFVSGCDDGTVRVWDYKQKRCNFILKGHIDYIRTTYFHHQLPWILSASDDQTMRLWNYQRRTCINIITGHCHYVMCAQFHPQKNLIISASLDSSIRLWDYQVLKKKLTQSKNLSSFIGIEIECIKILQGHDRGCNWVYFHPNMNIIASCSDDRNIKLWKYTNDIAWQHSTMLNPHKHNISCVLFDPVRNTLISDAQDSTVKIWNYQTKTLITGTKKNYVRYWILNISRNGSMLAAGHDTGFEIYQINKNILAFGYLTDQFLVYANGMKTYVYDYKKKAQKEQLNQYNSKGGKYSPYINRILVNEFNRLYFTVQVIDNQHKQYSIKKKQSYLQYPLLIMTIQGIDFCFINYKTAAILIKSNQIHITDGKQKKILTFKDDLNIKQIFSFDQENIAIFITNKNISFYNFTTMKNLYSFILEQQIQVNQIYIKIDKIAFICDHKIIILDKQMQLITKIEQNNKNKIVSAYWNKPNLLFYFTQTHWKYAFMNGQTGVLKTLQYQFQIFGKTKDQKYMAMTQSKTYIELDQVSSPEIQFKWAIIQKRWAQVKELVKLQPKNKKSMITYLIEKGLASIALDFVQDHKQKLYLAIQCSNFQLAFELCNQINNSQYWQMLGDQALKQGIFQAYELAAQKKKQYDKLNFLYSLQNNKPKLQKMLRLASKAQDYILAFNSALFLNNAQQQEQILRNVGLDTLGELSAEGHGDPNSYSQRLKALGCGQLNVVQVENEVDFSNWVHNVIEDQQQIH